MEGLGDDYIVHNLPLLVISGLNDLGASKNSSTTSASSVQEGGFRVRIELPVLDSPISRLVLQAFKQHDGSEAAWKVQAPSAGLSKLFKVKNVGRVFSLPPRKAPPPPHSPRLTAGYDDNGTPAPLVLHSPLSPLTPSSPLYPDGIVTPLWIAKHQYHLPCVLIVFFTLTADLNTSSLLDNKIKTEINSVRSALSSTSYKTRLVTVLLSDGHVDAGDLEERLGLVRRAANLDSKSLFFCPHNASQTEVNEFTRSLLSSLYPNCIEYYRDLSKHARRKRNRGSAPQPTIPPSQGHPLSSQGWTCRYEFKLGVFAEFRQEMEAACRNYEAAYESLFSSEVIETIPIQDANFNNARRLSDIIAIRIIRCLLWNGQSTGAVKTWVSHRDRIQDLLDRRAGGVENKAWEAWQSSWSKTMAQLVSRSSLPALGIRLPGSADIISLYAGAEKSLPVGERIAPWEYLAHEGYWLILAQEHTRSCRSRAMQGDEDEEPNVKQRNRYLASFHPDRNLKPGEDPSYTEEIVRDLQSAISYFTERHQMRMRERLLLKQAIEHVQSEKWREALHILQPMWQNQVWRQNGWWQLLQLLGWSLFDCAQKLSRPDLLLPLAWELGNRNFDSRPRLQYDLERLVEANSAKEGITNVSLDSSTSLMMVMPSFAFVATEGAVGEPVNCQLILESCSHQDNTPMTLTAVKIIFEGSLRPVYLTHDDNDASAQATSLGLSTTDVKLQEPSRLSASGDKRASAGGAASLIASANLTFHPSNIKIFNLLLTPREAGEVSVASITLIIEHEKFHLTAITSDFEGVSGRWFETKDGIPLSRLIGPQREVHKLQVLPKPPKVEIVARDFKKTYYTNEDIRVDLDVLNNEDEGAVISVQARLISPIQGAARLAWHEGSVSSPVEDDETVDTVQSLSTKDLGSIASKSLASTSLSITETVAAVDHELEITVTYHLESDEETTLQKALVLDIAIIRPFEANYDFSPRLLSDPWPNFFAMPIEPTANNAAQGLQHLYQVTANLFSFAGEPVMIEAILLTTTSVTGGAIATCTTGVLTDAPDISSDAPKSQQSDAAAAAISATTEISTLINPEQTHKFTFDLTVHKHILGNRDPVNLGLALEIGWRRPDSQSGVISRTTLEVPPFQILMAEPRVLLTLEKKEKRVVSDGMATYSLLYTIENPSMHFLTFNMAMESSDEFAFTGPKAVSVSLVPISRYEVRYKILPKEVIEGKGRWVKVALSVVDAYFNQSLRVQPAGEGVKVDRKGVVTVWVS